jgi:hypothetical protein
MGMNKDELLASIKEAGSDLLDPILGATVERFSNPAVMLSLAKQAGNGNELPETVCMADVVTERIDWLWFGYIPYGSVTIIQGDPGVGKGSLTIDIAARLSRGCPMPNSELECEPVNTLLLNVAEDDLKATIKPRLDAAGADCRHVFAFKDIVRVPNDLPFIENKIKEYEARFVVIDPLNAYLSGDVDGHKDQDIRRAFAPLKVLAEQYHVAIVLVHHLNKGAGISAMYRGGGSIGINGAARCVLLVHEHPQQAEQRVVARIKGNLSKPPPSLAFTLRDHDKYSVPVLDWQGVVEMTADQLLNPPKDDARDEAKLKQATDFYTRELADGKECPSAEVDVLLRTEGISFRTAERARKALGVKSRKDKGKGGKWLVYLPKTATPDTSELDGELGELGELGGVTPVSSSASHSQAADEEEERLDGPKSANSANSANNYDRQDMADMPDEVLIAGRYDALFAALDAGDVPSGPFTIGDLTYQDFSEIVQTDRLRWQEAKAGRGVYAMDTRGLERDLDAALAYWECWQQEGEIA